MIVRSGDVELALGEKILSLVHALESTSFRVIIQVKRQMQAAIPFSAMPLHQWIKQFSFA